MGKRRKAREVLVQACYAWRISGKPLLDCLSEQFERRQPAEETAAFARDLALKLAAHSAENSRWLQDLLRNWDPERVGVLERCILHVGLTELRTSPDVPYRVVINEACELARLFCDEDAVGFVNGILDRAAAALRSGQDPSGGPRAGSRDAANRGQGGGEGSA